MPRWPGPGPRRLEDIQGGGARRSKGALILQQPSRGHQHSAAGTRQPESLALEAASPGGCRSSDMKSGFEYRSHALRAGTTLGTTHCGRGAIIQLRREEDRGALARTPLQAANPSARPFRKCGPREIQERRHTRPPGSHRDGYSAQKAISGPVTRPSHRLARGQVCASNDSAGPRCGWAGLRRAAPC